MKPSWSSLDLGDIRLPTSQPFKMEMLQPFPPSSTTAWSWRILNSYWEITTNNSLNLLSSYPWWNPRMQEGIHLHDQATRIRQSRQMDVQGNLHPEAHLAPASVLWHPLAQETEDDILHRVCLLGVLVLFLFPLHSYFWGPSTPSMHTEIQQVPQETSHVLPYPGGSASIPLQHQHFWGHPERTCWEDLNPTRLWPPSCKTSPAFHLFQVDTSWLHWTPLHSPILHLDYTLYIPYWPWVETTSRVHASEAGTEESNACERFLSESSGFSH